MPNEVNRSVRLQADAKVARRRTARSARRLLLIFAATILTPGVILAGLGLRALTQERQNAERQAQQTLGVVAKNIGRRLELDLREWQQAAADVARSRSVDPSQWPARVRDAVRARGSWSSSQTPKPACSSS